MMMTSLAENLLRTRAIADLSVAVDNLNNEAIAKKSELQKMVGSQYNQFILSADKIIEMKSASNRLMARLDNSFQLNQKLSRSLEILFHSDKLKSQMLSFESHYPSKNDSQIIWELLSRGDMYSAVVYFLQHYNLRIANPNKSHIFDSTLFLGQTILEHCEAIYSCSSSGSDQLISVAKALAGHFLLCNYGLGKPYDNLESMNKFLKVGEFKLNVYFERLMSDRNDLEKDLSNLIAFLQSYIVCLYFIFLKRIPSPSASSMSGSSSTSSVSGLLEYYYLWMLEESSNMDITTSTGNNQLKNRMNPKTLKALEQRMKEWLMEKLNETSRVCSTVLSSMNTALGIARLQRFVFMECLGVSHTNKAYPYELRNGFVDYDFSTAWKESIEGLFGTGQKRHKTREEDASYLWTVVFQKSFIDQATRLLQEASDQIFLQLCSKVKQVLSNFGIQIDNHSNIKVLSTSLRIASTLSSVNIYAFADQLHSEFRKSLTKLLDDVISPIQSTRELDQTTTGSVASYDYRLEGVDDFHSIVSTNELLDALDLIINRLFGQILAHFRCLLDGFVKSFPCLQLSPFSSPKAFSAYHKTSAPDSSLLDKSLEQLEVAEYAERALLFLSRLLIIMQNKEAFVLRLSERNGTEPRKVTPSGSTYRLSVTEEQVKSAFEIADADGDGILRGEEVREALSALSIRNTFEETCRILPQNLNYSEFFLCFGLQHVSSAEVRPTEITNRCFNDLIRLANLGWIALVILPEWKKLDSSLTEELDLLLQSLQGREGVSLTLFRDPVRDVITPTDPSVSLLSFLFWVSNHYTENMISSDTFHLQCDLHARSSSNAATTVLSFVQGIAFEVIGKVYLKLYQKIQGEKHFSFDLENRILQYIFDLLLVAEMSDLGDPIRESFLQLIESLEAFLDPVTSQHAIEHARYNAPLFAAQFVLLTHFRSEKVERSPLETLPADVTSQAITTSFPIPSDDKNIKINPTSMKFPFLPLALTTPVNQPISKVLHSVKKSDRIEVNKDVTTTTTSESVRVENSTRNNAGGIKWW